MKSKLTEKQREVLEFIEKKIDESGRPSYSDISKAFGFTVTAARDYITKLSNKGYLDANLFKTHGRTFPVQEPKILRGSLLERLIQKLPLAGKRRDLYEIPVYRHISEVEPYLKDKYVEDTITFQLNDVEYIKDECFAFRYTSDSMSGSGILKDDLVIGRLAEVARDNEIALVNANGKNVLRRVYCYGSQVILLSDNPGIEPKIYSHTDIHVICQMIGVQRLKP